MEDTKRHETELKCERRKEYEEKAKSEGRSFKGTNNHSKHSWKLMKNTAFVS